MNEPVVCTVGFLFDEEREHVLLILKNRPAWQSGKFNGIGGKVEPGETPLQCMRREFKEEAGLDMENWQRYCRLHSNHGTDIHFYRALADRATLVKFAMSPRPTGDGELVTTVRVDKIASMSSLIPNLTWFIPMALRIDDDSAEWMEIWER